MLSGVHRLGALECATGTQLPLYRTKDSWYTVPLYNGSQFHCRKDSWNVSTSVYLPVCYLGRLCGVTHCVTSACRPVLNRSEVLLCCMQAILASAVGCLSGPYNSGYESSIAISADSIPALLVARAARLGSSLSPRIHSFRQFPACRFSDGWSWGNRTHRVLY